MLLYIQKGEKAVPEEPEPAAAGEAAGGAAATGEGCIQGAAGGAAGEAAGGQSAQSRKNARKKELRRKLKHMATAHLLKEAGRSNIKAVAVAFGFFNFQCACCAWLFRDK